MSEACDSRDSSRAAPSARERVSTREPLVESKIQRTPLGFTSIPRKLSQRIWACPSRNSSPTHPRSQPKGTPRERQKPQGRRHDQSVTAVTWKSPLRSKNAPCAKRTSDYPVPLRWGGTGYKNLVFFFCYSVVVVQIYQI